MEHITKHKGYQYVGLSLATIFLLPQLYASYKRKQMVDVSAASLWCVFFSSFLWGLYMWENDSILFFSATFFVNMNSFALLLMKLYFYQMKVNEHFKSFGKDPPQISILTKSSETPEPTCA